MRGILLYILLILSLFPAGCGKRDKITQQKQSTDSAVLKTDSGKTENKKVSGSADALRDIKYDVNEFLNELSYDGSVVSGVQWKDKSGQNVLIITETEPERNKTDDYDESVSKKLFGYAFVKNEEGKFQLVWMIQDYINKCPLDLTLSYIPNSLTVTDLNKNDVAECTFLYKMSCKGDVSPNDLKLMMHEGRDKFAIRGETILKLPNEKPFGGTTNVDKSFDEAPKEFLEYAKKEWKKFQEEKL